MRGNLVGKTFSSVSKQDFTRNVPGTDREKPMDKVVILKRDLTVGFTSRIAVYKVFKHPLNSREETKRMVPWRSGMP